MLHGTINTCTLQNVNLRHVLPPSAGLEEDFKVWLDDFAREVLPVLVGERAVQDETTCGGSSPCECGKKSEADYCKTPSGKDEVRGGVLLVLKCRIISTSDTWGHSSFPMYMCIDY